MTQEEIINGNKLIHAFMGYDDIYADKGYLETAKYHTLWQLLMPVVEKIQSAHGYSFTSDWKWAETDRREWKVWFGDNHDAEYGESLAEATYKAVIAFITWYNQHTR